MNTSYGSTATPSYPNSKGYLDYHASMAMSDVPEYIWDATISPDFPAELPRDRFFNNIEISGVVTHPNGTPRANEQVIIYMPLTLNYNLYEKLTTDSSGKFSINKNVSRDIYGNDSLRGGGDITGKETKYAWASKDVNGQDFYFPTQLQIVCRYEAYKQNVTATVGHLINGILLGGRWLWSVDPADYTLKWRELG